VPIVSSVREQLLQEAARLREQALAAMTQLAGGTSACARAKDGQSFPAYKFHEGSATALGQVSRRLQDPSTDATVVMSEVVQRWQQEVDRCSARGRDWQAYAAGGLDAMRSVEALTSGSDPSGGLDLADEPDPPGAPSEPQIARPG
jgi:hypothetical protein